jgi:hypothetical protein
MSVYMCISMGTMVDSTVSMASDAIESAVGAQLNYGCTYPSLPSAAVLITSVKGIAIVARTIEMQSHAKMRGLTKPLVIANIILRAT